MFRPCSKIVLGFGRPRSKIVLGFVGPVPKIVLGFVGPVPKIVLGFVGPVPKIVVGLVAPVTKFVLGFWPRGSQATVLQCWLRGPTEKSALRSCKRVLSFSICSVECCAVLSQHCTVMHSNAQYCAIQCAVFYSAVKYYAVLCSIVH